MGLIMSYSLSAEEIMQLMGIKSGVLTDIIESSLKEDIFSVDVEKRKEIINQIKTLSEEINLLANGLSLKTSYGGKSDTI
jgi:hypothetical protein